MLKGPEHREHPEPISGIRAVLRRRPVVVFQHGKNTSSHVRQARSMTDHIQSFLLLTVLSLTYSYCLRWKEKLRRAVVSDRIPDMLGLWTFAGVMLLPPSLIVALVVLVNLGEWPSRRAVGNGRPFKYAVSTVGTAASCLVASYVLHHPALGAFNIP